MIINDTATRRRKIDILSDVELAIINEFLIEEFVKKLSGEKWIAVRDVYPGSWSKIPRLNMLYLKHLAKYNNDDKKASGESAKALGYIIANLLRSLPEKYERDKAFRTWRYRLVSSGAGQNSQNSGNANGNKGEKTPIDLPELDKVNISVIEIGIDKYPPSPSAKNKKPQSPKKYNPQSDIEKKRIGDRGEELVIKSETDRLKRLGLDHTKVKHTSKDDDTAGYDIASLDEKGNPICIEVKSTTRDVGFVEFDISGNEYSKAMSKNNYWIYLVFGAHTTTPKICRLHGLFSNRNIQIIPASYKVTFTAKY